MTVEIDNSDADTGAFIDAWGVARCDMAPIGDFDLELRANVGNETLHGKAIIDNGRPMGWQTAAGLFGGDQLAVYFDGSYTDGAYSFAYAGSLKAQRSR